MTELFGREVKFAVGSPGETGRVWSDLRVDFKVRHQLRARGNAEITVYNPSDEAVGLVKGDDAVIRLFAGYDEAPMIFQGTPTQGSIEDGWDGPDRTLELEAQDGGRALAQTFINLSISADQTVREVTDRIVDELGLPTGTVEVPEGLRFPQGLQVSGRAAEVMRRLSRNSGADFSIQDGAIQVVPDDGDTGRRGVVLSAEDGTLVGSPEQKDKGWEATGLLRPELRPGDVYRLEHERVTGFFKARDVKFRGSRFTDEFHVIVIGDEYQ